METMKLFKVEILKGLFLLNCKKKCLTELAYFFIDHIIKSKSWYILKCLFYISELCFFMI